MNGSARSSVDGICGEHRPGERDHYRRDKFHERDCVVQRDLGVCEYDIGTANVGICLNNEQGDGGDCAQTPHASNKEARCPWKPRSCCRRQNGPHHKERDDDGKDSRRDLARDHGSKAVDAIGYPSKNCRQKTPDHVNPPHVDFAADGCARSNLPNYVIIVESGYGPNSQTAAAARRECPSVPSPHRAHELAARGQVVRLADSRFRR